MAMTSLVLTSIKIAVAPLALNLLTPSRKISRIVS